MLVDVEVQKEVYETVTKLEASLLTTRLIRPETNVATHLLTVTIEFPNNYRSMMLTLSKNLKKDTAPMAGGQVV